MESNIFYDKSAEYKETLDLISKLSFISKNPSFDIYFGRKFTISKNLKEFPRFSLIDSAVSLQKAQDSILTSQYVSIDCEGETLSRRGKLSLVQICTEKKETFIFDYLLLGKELLEFLKILLSNSNILKLVYDFRNDADLLFNQFAIDISHILDMQLVDFWKKTNLNLFSDSLAEEWKSRVKGGKYEWGVCLLPSLKFYFEKPIDQMKKIQKGDWMLRPLEENTLEYSAMDVKLIILLYEDIIETLEAKNFVTRFKNLSIKYWESIAKKNVRTYNQWEENEVIPIQIFSDKAKDIKCTTCKEWIPSDMIYKASKKCLRCHLKYLR